MNVLLIIEVPEGRIQTVVNFLSVCKVEVKDIEDCRGDGYDVVVTKLDSGTLLQSKLDYGYEYYIKRKPEITMETFVEPKWKSNLKILLKTFHIV